jgi:hypothetical protein
MSIDHDVVKVDVFGFEDISFRVGVISVMPVLDMEFTAIDGH